MSKKDFTLKILPYVILVCGVAAYVAIITEGKYWYGSELDWDVQHYHIPEYFRTLFYSTGDFFPSFGMNIGSGENIYNLSYYGLYSPVILFSYLLPFVPMKIYIIIAAIFSVIFSSILIYRWLIKRFNLWIGLFGALVFEFATPILFHSHRHVLYIFALPFIILAFQGMEKYIYQGKKTQLILFTFLSIMCNWFLSASFIVALVIFGIFIFIEKHSTFILKDFLTIGIKAVGNILISILMATILWLPVLEILTSNRKSNSLTFSFADLFLPHFKGTEFLYTNSGMGFTVIFLCAITFGFLSKNKSYKFLSVVFTCFSLFGIFLFVLNGGMYIEGKVLIPFIPIGVFLICGLIEGTLNKEYSIKKLIIIMSILLLYSAFLYGPLILGLLLFDTLITIILLCGLYYKNIKEYYLFIIILFTFSTSVFAGLNDPLVPIDKQVINDEKTSAKLVERIQKKDDSSYRFGKKVNRDTSVNQIINSDYNTATIYSSLTNQGFNDFFFNQIYNECRFRNAVAISPPENILFNLFIGNKYILSKEDSIIGYEKVESLNGIKVYKNENAKPIGYASDKLISKEVFDNLSKEDRAMAITTCVVVPIPNKNDYISSVKELDYKGEIKKGKTTSLKLNKRISNKIIFANMNVDNRISKDKKKNLPETQSISKKNDVTIKVNGIRNKLTDPDWKYKNNNYSFEYVVSSNNPIDSLSVEASKGDYKVSKPSLHSANYEDIVNSSKHVDAMKIKKMENNIIEGEIQVKKDGWFTTTIPWDKNFKVYLDGKEVNYYKTNLTFIGMGIEKGTHSVKIIFESKIQKISIGLSALGIMIFTIVAVKDGRRKKWKKYH